MDLFRKVSRLLALSLIITSSVTTLHADEDRVKVSGFGLFGNIELKGALRLLEIEEGELGSRKIDDGAFLLLTRLKQNGYLDAKVNGHILLSNGETRTVEWTTDFEPQLREDVTAESVRYEIEEDTLYYYESVQIKGLTAIDEEEATQYFVPDAALFSSRKDRSYSPSIFNNQQKQLVAALVALGYTDAKIVDRTVDIDPATGAVSATVTVDEGPLYIVQRKRVAIYEDAQLVEERDNQVSAVYNRFWMEEHTRALRNESYKLGFPDTRIASKITESARVEGQMNVAVLFEVRRGNKVILTSVEHVGATDTREELLDRKAKLEEGEPLDITEVEAARRRISRLGVFDRVDLNYEPHGSNGRKVIFDYENSTRLKWELLVGYGSYESFRAGIIGRRINLFGRAHTASFQAVQSVKSTSGKLNYTVPEIFGETISGKVEATYLDREELFFDRAERGASIGLSTFLRGINTDVGIDYSFDRKRSSDPQFNVERGLEEVNIGSISLRAAHNAVDNILYPSNGYEIHGSVRYAAKALGGETEFVRPEFGASYHTPFGNRWILHLSGNLGFLSEPGDNATEVPPAELFLIGGENTLRGYRRMEAGPIDPSTGIPKGARGFVLFNAEVEYPILDKLNAVLFVDSARTWRTTEDFGDYEDLISIGIGLRYRTIIGPVRLEYGHNLDPRPGDPDGTLHLSIGFPF